MRATETSVLRRAEPVWQTDVAIVGAGAAGLAAAAEAASHGARVVVLEKNPRPGGSTALAVGAMTAPATSLQHRRGIQDSLEAFVADLEGSGGPEGGQGNPELRALLVQNLSGVVEWLQGLGVGFVGPFPEAPHRVPRLYCAVPDGRGYVNALLRAARRRGAQVLCAARVTDLLRDGKGRVCGLQWQDGAGVERRVEAARGVILSSGDFSASLALKRQYLSPEVAEIEAVNPGNTGDGHRLGVRAGGQLVNMQRLNGPKLRFPPPPTTSLMHRVEHLLAVPGLGSAAAWLVRLLPPRLLQPFMRLVLTSHMAPEADLYAAGAILVNQMGRRFTNELRPLATAVAAQPGRRAFVVLDARLAETFSRPPRAIATALGLAAAYFSDYARNRPDLVCQAGSIPRLAERLGLNGQQLLQSVNTYNDAMLGRDQDPFGRPASGQALTEPPFHALGPVEPRLATTRGGLRINVRCQVLDARGEPVPALYAAGATGQGELVIPGSGFNIAWAVVSGRTAGREAAQPVD